MNKKSLFIVLLVLFFGQLASAFQIVYPKMQNVTINSDKTFFIGNEKTNKVLKINGETVKLHPSGGFKHVVKLNYGQNLFVIDNGKDKKIYKINRPQVKKNTPVSSKSLMYEAPVVISVTKENTPLRSTPADSGLNRLQHLSSGIDLYALGEERGFYRVKLGRDGFGFIAKDSAAKTDKTSLEYANLKYGIHQHQKGNKFVEIFLDQKVPYIVTDSNSGLDIYLYNIDNFIFEQFEEHIYGRPFGYSSYYNGDNALIVSMKEFPKVDFHHPLKGIKITIDPGHGGSEAGATGCLGHKEKDVNLAIAKNLRTKLENLGADVLMTREDDSYVGLYERVEKSNYFGADIFLSIHNNALPDTMADRDATGTEVYYFYPQARDLAKVLAKSISDKTGFKNGGAKGQSFAVIRNTQSVAVLLEIGFMINPDDNAKLIDQNFQDKISDGIIDGLERYLKQDEL